MHTILYFQEIQCCEGLPMLCPGLSCGCPAFCPGVRSSPCVQSVRYTACTQLKHGFVLLEHLIRVAIGALCIPVCLCVHLYNLLHAHEVVLAHCVCLCVHLYNLLHSTCTRGCVGAPGPKTLVLQSSGRSLAACRARLQSLRGAQKVSTCAD